MAKRRSKRRRKNPSRGAWIALGIGGIAAAGLIGYGIYRSRQGDDELVLEGAGGPMVQTWGYRVIRSANNLWIAQIVMPGGGVHNLPNQPNAVVASQAAQSYITAQGGVPVLV